jgi:ppGpp synthetase/RelA/SpoT-type nucleotidyltranferase
VKCYIWSTVLYGDESWTLQEADQKYLESFEMRCWRRMEISVRNMEVLHRVKEETNLLRKIKKKECQMDLSQLVQNMSDGKTRKMM